MSSQQVLIKFYRKVPFSCFLSNESNSDRIISHQLDDWYSYNFWLYYLINPNSLSIVIEQ